MKVRLTFILLLLSFVIVKAKSTEKEALEFLYQYLPEADRAGYSEDFFRQNVEMALRARREMPWGEKVSDTDWQHFVLPVRVNNEDLDLFRVHYYDELKQRVEGMTMEEAILEVNHWCHEHVTYKPSDGRTASPMSTIHRTTGRCGEESTLLVAALRTIGIPARQVYTLRWAHTDDNHAWVEAQADGQWHFLGACEPAPVLDMGWFNASASRGALMTTKAFGDYSGPEEVISHDRFNTLLNVTRHYAPTRTLTVTVKDAKGKRCPGAQVDLCIYNYSELSRVVTLFADKKGEATLTTGLCDIPVLVSYKGKWGMAKSGTHDTALTVTLRNASDMNGEYEWDITVPRAASDVISVPDSLNDICNRRLAYEDSIRIAKGVPEMPLDFHRRNAEADSILWDALCEKDKLDIPQCVYDDCLDNTLKPEGMEDEIYARYLLNPRVACERLTPYRTMLRDRFKSNEQEDFRADPRKIERWMAENIAIDNTLNPEGIMMTPEAVMAKRRADEDSRTVCYVALCRALGVAARLNPVDALPEYYSASDKRWHPAMRSNGNLNKGEGVLRLGYTDTGSGIPNPKYWSNFSISAVNPAADGNPISQLLEYPDEASVADFSTPGESLQAGQYIVVGGMRLASGDVKANINIVDVKPEKQAAVALTLRGDEEMPGVIGGFDAENRYFDISEDIEKSLLASAGRGYYALCMVRAAHEPSIHLLHDIEAVAAELNSGGLPLLLIFESEEEMKKFRKEDYSLPANVHIGYDSAGGISADLRALCDEIEVPYTLPAVIVADTFGKVVNVQTDYSIGTGSRILDIARKLLNNLIKVDANNL